MNEWNEKIPLQVSDNSESHMRIKLIIKKKKLTFHNYSFYVIHIHEYHTKLHNAKCFANKTLSSRVEKKPYFINA